MMPTIVDLPGSARVDTLISPAFATRPPELHNEHLLSPALRDLYKRLWNQNRPQGEIACFVVNNALVDGPGLVFDGDFRLFRQTVHQTTPAEIERALANIRSSAANGSYETRKGVTLLCEKTGIGNYGHWLVEMLPIPFLNLKHLFTPGGWRLAAAVARRRTADERRDPRFGRSDRRTRRPDGHTADRAAAL